MAKNQGKGKIWKVFLFIIAENSKHGNIKLGFYYVYAYVHADIVEYFNPATDTLEIHIVHI
jgi:hypothetical protein